MFFQAPFFFFSTSSGLVGKEAPEHQVGNLKTHRWKRRDAKEGSWRVVPQAWEDPFPTRSFFAIPRERDRRHRGRALVCTDSRQHYCSLESFKCCEDLVDT